jgi:hypothetical protein
MPDLAGTSAISVLNNPRKQQPTPPVQLIARKDIDARRSLSMDENNLPVEDDMKSVRSLTWYTITLFSLIVLLASFVWGKNVELTSQRPAQGIKVDGQIGDWPENSMTFLEEQQATVGLCNDSANVYVLVCSREAGWARLIRMTGLTVYLDAKGEKQKDFMLKFTGGPTREQIMAAGGEKDVAQRREMPPEMRDRMRGAGRNAEPKFICFQKDVISEKEIPVDGTEGPAVAFGIDKGFFVYEFSIPLKESGVRFYGLGVPPSKKVGLGLVWGEMDKSARPEGMGEGGPGGRSGGGMPPGGGMPGGGGMGRPGGGGPGGGPPGGRGGFEMPKKQEVWLKVQLTGTGSAIAAPSDKK